MTVAAAKKALSKTGTKRFIPAKKATAAGKSDFAKVFSALRAILVPYEGRLSAKIDRPDYYYLESHGPTYRNRPMCFAAVRAGKSYVSYHVMPVYACPELGKSISAGLKKRMQGKACFNFKDVDPNLFEELARLTEEGFEKFRNLRLLR